VWQPRRLPRTVLRAHARGAASQPYRHRNRPATRR
jgi:hypothetical protein